MAGFGWLTPDSIPTDTICRVLLIPNDEQIIANVTGAIESLTEAWNWETFGTLTPEQAADGLTPMFDSFCFGSGICRVIGEIIPYAGSTSPNANWLVCDGSSLLRSTYPVLFALIGTTYGSADGTHFNIPDLQGRVPIGAGSGAGLSTWAVGDQAGEETHTLTNGESASHTHTDSGHTHVEGIAIPAVGSAIVVPPIPSAIPGVGATGVGFAGLSTSGGDGGHNNLQPLLALNYLIVAQ